MSEIEIPKEDWTESQREFVGDTFITPKGGTISVVGVTKDEKYRIKFICECSICSKDKVLWYRGSIRSTKSNLKYGNIPCGCSKTPLWNEDQNKIRVQRVCDERDYIFNGWFGEYKGSKTKLDLENPSTGNKWKSVILYDFINGTGDPVESSEKVRKYHIKNDTYHLEDFYKAGFTKEYKFWRSDRKGSDNRSSYWYYTCPICSNDEYVQNGLCSGVFEIHRSSLKKGNRTCRCSKAYYWTKEQREYQITKILNIEGGKFIKWDGLYKNAFSGFLWECNKGHIRPSNSSQFLIKGFRCSTCRDLKHKESGICYGYYPKRVLEKDFLYIIYFGNYIKIGRTFDINYRLYGSEGLVKKSGVKPSQIEILQLFTSNHQTVYDTEQYLHEELTSRGFYYNESDGQWSTELFSLDCLPALEYLLKDIDIEEVDVSTLDL